MKLVIVIAVLFVSMVAAVPADLSHSKQPLPVPPRPDREGPHESKRQAPLIVVGVPFDLKSTYASDLGGPQLTLTVTNERSETVALHWVDYQGQAVFYANIQPNSSFGQLTYGRHPWLITTSSGELLDVVVAYLSNADITISQTASW